MTVVKELKPFTPFATELTFCVGWTLCYSNILQLYGNYILFFNYIAKFYSQHPNYKQFILRFRNAHPTKKKNVPDK